MECRRTIPKFSWIWIPWVIILLGLTACGQDKTEKAASLRTPDRGAVPDTGGTAVVALAGDPDVLNSLIRRSASAGMILDLLQDSLADMGEDLEWHPRIAESWEIAPDRTSITYHLRDWSWSDGVPLTSADVVRTFALFMDPAVGSPRKGQFSDVSDVEAPDSRTVVYRFTRPLPDPVARSFHAILPEHLVRDLEPAEVMGWEINRHPLSCGPFQLENWDPGQSLTLVPNLRYPLGRPYLDRVVFRIIPDPAGQVVALETGQVDMVTDVTPGDAERLQASGKVRIVPAGGRQYYYLNWNLRRPLFADSATRKALSLALDRQRMIDTLLRGYGRPAVGPMAPVMWNFHRKLKADPYAPEQARRMLAEAGWQDTDGDGIVERDGQPLRFTMLTKLGDPVRENGAVIIRENLRTVGAEVEIRVLELAAGLELLNRGEYDAYFGSFNANLYGDPTSVVHSEATQDFNKGHYANAEVDSLLDLALSLPDRAEALPVWYRLQEVLLADPPSAYLFYPEKLVGVSHRLQDVRPHVLSPWNNISHWWIATEDRRYRTSP